MKRIILHIIFSIACVMFSQAQESSSALALDLPSRNSLMFNKYILSPTFSYVREDKKYFSINNKRELVQLEDAPQTYLASFSGRFSDKVGAGIGLFQRNFGIFKTFGGIANIAYNTPLTRESNLTFGLNISAFNNSIDTGNLITTVDDPFVNNIPSTFFGAVSPGINYGGGFIDVGVTINNLVTYNSSTSQIATAEVGGSVQGHLLYTGYVDTRGFFNDSKLCTNKC